jgi:hypothetical protein
MQEARSAGVDASALAPLQAAFDERITSHMVHLAAAAATGTFASAATLAGVARRLGLHAAVDAAHATVVARIAAARMQVLAALEVLLAMPVAARGGQSCTCGCLQGDLFGAVKPVEPADCALCSIEELLAAEVAALSQLGRRPYRDKPAFPAGLEGAPQATNTEGTLYSTSTATCASPVPTQTFSTFAARPLGRVCAAADEAARVGLCPLAMVALESVLIFARWHLAAASRTSTCAVVCQNYSGTVLSVWPSHLTPLAAPLSHSPLASHDPLLSHFSQWQSAAPNAALPAWALIVPLAPRHAVQLAAMQTLQNAAAAQAPMDECAKGTCACPDTRTPAAAMHGRSSEPASASASRHATAHSRLVDIERTCDPVVSTGSAAKSGGTVDGSVLTPAMLHACTGTFEPVNTDLPPGCNPVQCPALRLCLQNSLWAP